MSKDYKELTIRDSFMFGKISSDDYNRKLILDSLLQIDLHEKKGEVEKHLRAYKSSKYTRLDLISEDERNIVYNAEMQNKSANPARQKELPNRSRYYQSIIDTDYFEARKNYLDLPETYIIFICTFDPFGKNIPMYSFETKCNEIDIPEYNDKAHKIYFNTTADLSSLPPGTRNMLKYINDGVANDDATKTLDEAVHRARLIEEWRSEYMLTFVHDNDVYRDGYDAGVEDGKNEGLAEGRVEGLAEGRVEGEIRTLTHLLNQGAISIEIAAKQAGLSVAEFENKMKEYSKSVQYQSCNE